MTDIRVDLAKLTPAPWTARDVDDEAPTQYISGPETVVCDGCSPKDAAFIALARNAFDAMMRRNWSPMFTCEPDYNDQDRWGWKVFSGPENGYVGSDPTRLYPDPFTALVAADEWYKANVEAREGGAR